MSLCPGALVQFRVRYWHKADIPSCTAHIRFRFQVFDRPLLTRCLLVREIQKVRDFSGAPEEI